MALMFDLGSVFLDGGQEYLCTAVEPYTRINGQPSKVLVWTGHGATCGEPFQVKSGRKPRPGDFNRRCPEHKAPGVRVAR